MSWSKTPVKLPFVPEVVEILGQLKPGLDAVTGVLDAAVVGLKAARALQSANSDPYVALFGALVTEMENLIEDTFNAGVYSLTVDPRYVAGNRVRTLNAAFPTDISLEEGDGLTPAAIESRRRARVAAGTDPILTYSTMKLKVQEKNSSFAYDNFGVPLMTPRSCVNHMVSSFDDELDSQRPQFSNDAEVAALGFIVSAPDLDSFVALAQPLLDLLDTAGLANFIREILKKSGRAVPSTDPSGGVLPDWTAQARLSDFGFIRAQRDALLSGLAQVRAVKNVGAVDGLLASVQNKLQVLNEVTKEFSSLLSKLQSALTAEGVFVFYEDTVGGVAEIKRRLRQVEPSASTMMMDQTGYTYGFLLLGGGPSLQAVRTMGSLLLTAQQQGLIGGRNAKQKITFSAKPGAPDSVLTVGGVPVGFVFTDGSYPSDGVLRQSIQAAVNTTLASEAVVLLSTVDGGEKSTSPGTEGYNPLPDIMRAEKDGLGFTVEFQGQDGRQPQPLLDFSDPGQDEIQEICFSEAPTGGTFSLSYDGQSTGSLPYTATSADVQAALNLIPALAGRVRVSGSFSECFTVMFSKMDALQLLVSSALTGPGGAVTASSMLIQSGRPPANRLRDRDGNPISITVETIVEGRRNDLCGD